MKIVEREEQYWSTGERSREIDVGPILDVINHTGRAAGRPAP